MKHFGLRNFAFVVLLLLGCSRSFGQINVVVAKDGTGNYYAVQDAIDAAPVGQTTPYVIYIKNGRYRERITVPSNKPFIQLVGESVANTILYYDNNALTVVGGSPLGTQGSASVSINANDFSAFNITFSNTYGDGSQAVAVLINADRVAFKNCRFQGNQDTLYTKGSATPPRAYFLNCYIDGNTDFIFGSSACLFDSCVVFAKIKPSITSSYITAPNTPTGQTYGYVFRNARINGSAGPNYYYLSRPWPSPSVVATAQKTVFLNSVMSNTVKPEGWAVWDVNTVTANTYYGEYNSKNNDGTPFNTASRVAWSYQLNAVDAATYTMANMFGTWDPCTVYPNFCSLTDSIFALSNFAGKLNNNTTASFTWNNSWFISGINVELYRSTSQYSGYSLLASSTTDTNFNYSYTDATLAAGTYYYYIKAYKTGYPTQYTDTLQIINSPNMTATASFSNFPQNVGSPSGAQTYTLSAASLTGNVTVTPPANFEVSTNGTTWYTNASPLVLTPVGGVVAATTVYVRLNAGAVGTYSGNIVNSSPGATDVNLAVTGTTIVYVPPANYVLQQWTMAQNNNDSAAVRSTAVAATTPAFSRLYSSTAASVAAVPAYSAIYGMAVGASSTVDGAWGTANGGPGGNLTRTYYVQFTVTANAGNSVHLDSFLLTSAFYNTNSGTKMAVVYSLSNFVADSSNVTGGTGLGVVLAVGANGGFTTPILLANQTTGGPTNAYVLALNGSTGVTLTAGQTATIRVYLCCSSSSAGRYGMLKNVMVKGYAIAPLSVELLEFNGVRSNNENKISWSTAAGSDLDHFEVERSENGADFYIVATVKPDATNDGRYSWIDRSAAPVEYYRLKTVSKNSGYTYSKTIELKYESKGYVKAYPNPVVDVLNVNYTGAGNAELQVLNMEGKIIMTKQIDATQTKLDVRQLPTGTYTLQIVAGYQRYTELFIKK